MNSKTDGFVWECECGNIEYGQYPPETCPKCQGVGTFNKVPEDLIEEKETEHFLSLKEEEDE